MWWSICGEKANANLTSRQFNLKAKITITWLHTASSHRKIPDSLASHRNITAVVPLNLFRFWFTIGILFLEQNFLLFDFNIVTILSSRRRYLKKIGWLWNCFIMCIWLYVCVCFICATNFFIQERQESTIQLTRPLLEVPKFIVDWSKVYTKICSIDAHLTCVCIHMHADEGKTF